MPRLTPDVLHVVFRLHELKQSGTRIYRIKAYDTYGSGLNFGQVLPPDKLSGDERKTAGIPTEITIGNDCIVMLRYNIDPLGGLCNRSIGKSTRNHN